MVRLIVNYSTGPSILSTSQDAVFFPVQFSSPFTVDALMKRCTHIREAIVCNCLVIHPVNQCKLSMFYLYAKTMLDLEKNIYPFTFQIVNS